MEDQWDKERRCQAVEEIKSRLQSQRPPKPIWIGGKPHYDEQAPSASQPPTANTASGQTPSPGDAGSAGPESTGPTTNAGAATEPPPILPRRCEPSQSTERNTPMGDT